MTVFLQDPDVVLHHGDALQVLRTLPAESVHCCVTSPPFYGLRDYGTGRWEGGDADCDHDAYQRKRNLEAQPSTPGSGSSLGTLRDGPPPNVCGRCGARRVDGQIGLEASPEAWVARLVDVFREVRRVLRRDGTLWLEVGDSYASGEIGRNDDDPRNLERRAALYGTGTRKPGVHERQTRRVRTGTKPKDLIGAPWLLAFALRADGWWLRSDIVWARPNPMPESVTDRPTKSHSYVFLLTKQARYFFDQEAVREPHRWQDEELLRTNAQARQGQRLAQRRADGDPTATRTQDSHKAAMRGERQKGRGQDQNNESEFSASPLGRNIRSVWEVEQETLDPSLPPEKPRGPDGRRQTKVEGREGSLQHRDGERWPNPAGANMRSVWKIPTQPFAAAHFATFPEELARRCILAGTSERGCCPDCGAPWMREVERGELVGVDRGGNYRSRGGDVPHNNPMVGHPEYRPGMSYERETIGWRPSCFCGHERGPDGEFGGGGPRIPIPCTVLDPFVGSGTVPHVARKHGRRAVGIDLNADYLKLAAARLAQQSLFAHV
jgi:DNA modification methylase